MHVRIVNGLKRNWHLSEFMGIPLNETDIGLHHISLIGKDASNSYVNLTGAGVWGAGNFLLCSTFYLEGGG